MKQAFAIGLLLALAGCSEGPPAGQVVARVNGTDITRRDVLLELVASGAPADVDTRTIAPALLDRIVASKLLAAEARRRSIDRSPEFLGRDRRNREQILGEELARRLIGRLPPPSPAEIAQYVEENRARLDQRRIFTIDRIVPDGPVDPAAIGSLESAGAVEAWLVHAGQSFTRSALAVDSLSLSPGHLSLLDAYHGRPVAITGDGPTSIDQIVASVPAPIAPADRARTAAGILRDRQSRQLMDRTLDRLRARAEIAYQPGYGGK